MEREDSFFSRQPKTLRDKYDESVNLSSSMMAMFEKHFAISDVQRDAQMYTLPKPGFMFTEPPWHLDKLQEIKRDLNEVKSRLNNFNLDKWQQHTNRMNGAGDIVRTVKENIQAELVTQAWCKFYEIASNFSLVPLNEIYHGVDKRFRSVHLCEAPGAFVTALNHWLKTNAPDVQWNWMATTLNPYCEGNSYDSMVADDRFIRHTLEHWYFGVDNTGDIMDLRNLDALLKKSESLKSSEGRILLVTADGSIDCTNVPGEQESTVAQLHLCETVACMHLLQKGGNFLLKLFTLFEHQSVCLMYLLSCAFHQVSVTKPASSKGGNSEMYVVCMNFKGTDYITSYLRILRHYYGNVSPVNAMFSLRDIPETFLCRLEQCSKFFKFHQCQVIQNNIRTFHMNDENLLFQMPILKQQINAKYLKDCRLSKIDPANEIVGREIIERNNNQFINKKLHIDSYNERCRRQDSGPRERLSQIWDVAKEIKGPSKKFYVWHLQALPEVIEIKTGKLFSRVRSSRFCDLTILQILNEIDNMMQEMHSTVYFPSAKFTRALARQIDSNHEILSFQFVQNYDSHQTITKIYDRLKKLQPKQTLILVGYSLLTQLNIGLLFLLGNFFNKIIIEIHNTEGYYLKLESYRYNERVLNYLGEILAASHNARKENMAIWSILPMTILYECDQFPVMTLLNHLMIKLYAHYVVNMIDDKVL
ncbi:cap-specific mRNA (nucleoside-2'-O-)-methyltransferase 2 isoform X1 [Monomorium pharaonis]|uniref:cap-specific mRNA (nucleoside-2'-O-)-methyltransferase 2 isoform X1 n=1 Tax=Monomorium pharaonis TaxID=307658 RepID=UPI00063F804F|nr:cap-specific mRNA (nucleoside-2'-O-)-methyltransferase 2 isoform X1 [Monomorium pharaonis]